MAKGLAAAAVAMVLAVLPAAAQAQDPLDAKVEANLAFASTQLKRTLAEVPTGSYPHYTRADGTWLTRPAGWWISGFFPGSLWLMYQATGDPAWRTAAAARQAAIEPYKTSTGTHDLGFMVFGSFGTGLELTGDSSYRDVSLTAANSLATRYSPVVRSIRSWNNASGDDPGDFRVIVDNMMNLELLFWASWQTGNTGHSSKALEHALRSMAEHVRADGSTHHLVIYDANTGAVRRKQTVQGYSDTSTWARGQAWALYGFAMAYRETRDARMLATARRVADWYIAHLPADRVPYWDFQAPGIPNEPRDSSAAAVATSGLLELSQLEPDAARGQAYLAEAKASLTSLSSSAYLAQGTTRRSLLLHGTSNKPAGEYDHGLIYGDYYFLEAMLRYRAIARNAPYANHERAPDYNGDGFSDLATGAPREDDGTLEDAGQVSVQYGTATGLEARRNQQLTQRFPGSTPEADDRFGGALASGDFDRDGYTDLAVGAPVEDVGSLVDTGQVTVTYGSPSGLATHRVQYFTQSKAGWTAETGDHFGDALASGDFDGDGYADLAAGAPGEGVGSAAEAGSVSVLYGSATGLSGSRAWAASQGGAGEVSEAGDRFGATLATTTRDSDGYADLIVGAPDEDVGSAADAGQITVLFGTASGLGASRSQQLRQSTQADAVEAGDRFGSALAGARFDGDAYGDVAVGAPGEDSGASADSGLVSVLYGSADGRSGRTEALSQGGAGGSTEAGDAFGAALGAGRLDGDPYFDLAVGAPDEDVGSAAEAGQVSVVYGSSSGVSGARNQQLSQAQASGTVEDGDRFGAALTTGLFDRDAFGDLAVGTPYEDDGSLSLADIGVTNIVYGAASGLSTRVNSYSQGGTGGKTEAGDRFGTSLR